MVDRTKGHLTSTTNASIKQAMIVKQLAISHLLVLLVSAIRTSFNVFQEFGAGDAKEICTMHNGKEFSIAEASVAKRVVGVYLGYQPIA
jgi:hypothetical protein